MNQNRRLGELLYKLENEYKIEIEGEKLDLNLSGTYKQIKKKYHVLANKLHPDVVSKSLSDEEKKYAEEIFKALSGAYEIIDKDKKEHKAKDDDKCTLVEEALKDYKDRLQKNTNRSKSTKAKSQTQSQSTTKNSYSSSYNSREKENIDSIKFSNGVLKKLQNDKNQQVFYTVDYKKVYGYVFTDNEGKEHKIFSENDINTLARPEYKYTIEHQMLSKENLEKIDSYDVQNSKSKFGYAGKIESFYDTKRVKTDYEIEKAFRDNELSRTTKLYFNGGLLEKLLDKEKNPVSFEINYSKIHGYVFTDKDGKKHKIFSESSFEEFAKPENKILIEKQMLSDENLKKIDLKDVQNAASQYGYAGKIGDSYLSKSIKTDYKVLDTFRNIELEKTETLTFNNGTFRKLENEKGQHLYRLENNSRVYGYIFTDEHGVDHKLYSENDFETFSNPQNKRVIETGMLSAENLKKIDSYDVQDKNSQYGYAGRINSNYSERKNIETDNQTKSRFREAILRKTKQLKFNGGTLERVLGRDNSHLKFNVGVNGLYAYNFIDKDGMAHRIYSENDFETLSDPSNLRIISDSMLSKENLRKIDSRDVQDPEAQYGYAGRTSYSLSDRKGIETDYRTILDLRNMELEKTKELRFGDKVVRRKENGDRNKHEFGSASSGTVYQYLVEDEKGVRTIYTKNSFRDLADPKAKRAVTEIMLSNENLEKAKENHDYVGEVKQSYSFDSKYSLSHDSSVQDYINYRFDTRMLIRDAVREDGSKKQMILPNGKTLYGYYVSRRGAPKGSGRDVYLENSREEMLQTFKEAKQKGKNAFDIEETIGVALERSSNWLKGSQDAQYGYAGRFTSDCTLDVDNSTIDILKNRIEKAKAKMEFENLKITEERLMDLMREDDVK